MIVAFSNETYTRGYGDDCVKNKEKEYLNRCNNSGFHDMLFFHNYIFA
jgi:hypothetical protein